jgi:hypothetical protein
MRKPGVQWGGVSMRLSTRFRRGERGRAILEPITIRARYRGHWGCPGYWGLGAVALLLAVAGCSDTSGRPAQTDVLGSVPLAPARQGDVPNSLVYRAPDLDTRPAPRCFYIPPTEIDTGKEAVFLEVTEQQKQIVADAVTTAFRHAIGQHQRVTTTAGPGCATLQLYLTGVTKTTPGQDMSGSPYSSLLGMSDVSGRNLQASVNGTITVAGKFMTPDGSVLAGFVNKVGTNAFDIPPNASPREIAMLAAARLATDIAGAVDREVEVQKKNHGSQSG